MSGAHQRLVPPVPQPCDARREHHTEIKVFAGAPVHLLSGDVRELRRRDKVGVGIDPPLSLRIVEGSPAVPDGRLRGEIESTPQFHRHGSTGHTPVPAPRIRLAGAGRLIALDVGGKPVEMNVRVVRGVPDTLWRGPPHDSRLDCMRANHDVSLPGLASLTLLPWPCPPVGRLVVPDDVPVAHHARPTVHGRPSIRRRHSAEWGRGHPGEAWSPSLAPGTAEDVVVAV